MNPDGLPLNDEQLERLVDLLVRRLADAKPAAPAMLTVDDICSSFQVGRQWVYENAGRLGGVKLGPGPRAPLRFDAKHVLEALRPVSEPLASESEPPRSRRHRQMHLLPVYDG